MFWELASDNTYLGIDCTFSIFYLNENMFFENIKSKSAIVSRSVEYWNRLIIRVCAESLFKIGMDNCSFSENADNSGHHLPKGTLY